MDKAMEYANIDKKTDDPTTVNYFDRFGREIPWFPRHISDIDYFREHVTTYGDELDADHPGFKDEVYRARRKEITQIAKEYLHGNPIPRVQYTPEEIATWKHVFTRLKELYPSHACKEHVSVMPILEKECGFSPDNIPQLEDINKYLKKTTGWIVRPVMGLLSSRDFLNAFAFRVFHATQYLRHSSVPEYTPEPDVVHELVGHVPLFADPAFARFSHELGLASLGASDEDIKRLGTWYWYTTEFGLCRQNGQIRAYGAGLLSSFGELEYSMSEKPEKRNLNVADATTTAYTVTEYQPLYFVAESFDAAADELMAFANSLDRPFSVYYNPYSETVEIIDSDEKLSELAEEIKSKSLLMSQAIAHITAAKKEFKGKKKQQPPSSTSTETKQQ